MKLFFDESFAEAPFDAFNGDVCEVASEIKTWAEMILMLSASVFKITFI